MGFCVREKLLEQITDIVGLPQVAIKNPSLALVKNSPLRIFKNGIGKRITLLDFFCDLSVKVTIWPFCFPEASTQIIDIAHDTIRTNAALHRLFWYQRPINIASGICQEVLES